MNNCIKVYIKAFLAGVCIALGATVYLSVSNKYLGAFLFSLGLFTICTMDFNLFTGKVCYALKNDIEYKLNLINVWNGNFLGTFVIGIIVYNSRIFPGIKESVESIIDTKMNDSLISLFLLGIICNIFIYIAVESYKNNPHELGKYLGLIFGVMGFILCGSEHCVADMFYFFLGCFSKSEFFPFGRLLIITLGNIVGGLLIPLIRKYLSKE